MKKRLNICAIVFGLLLIIYPSVAFTDSFTFTAGQVKGWMNDAGAPLSNADYYYALWRVRAIPEVTGGGFTITDGSTSQIGWEALAPPTFDWLPYGTNCAWFRDVAADGSPNPLYVIIDKPADAFTSYFGNTVTAVSDSSTFTINFTLDSDATWTGRFLFLVDGSKYSTAGGLPATWVDDFFGGNLANNEVGGGLANNSGLGYAVPIPGAVWLLGSGLLSLAGWRRYRKA